MATYYKPQSPIQSGEDFIYPITTADQVMVDGDTRLNAVGVYLENIDYSTDTTVYGNNATTLGGRAPGYYTNPRNLLDNSDFRNPVNQRGATSYSGAFIYGIDRWMTGDAGSMFIATDGPDEQNVAFTGNGSIDTSYMFQRVLETLRAGQTYTFAIEYYYNDGVISLSSRATDMGDAEVANSSDFQGILILTFTPSVDCTTENGLTYLRIQASGTVGLRWAALYKGSYTADTLPLYVPKGYAAELAECMRYYHPNIVCTGLGINSDIVIIGKEINPPMRKRPSITFRYITDGFTLVDATNAAVRDNNYTDRSIQYIDNVGKITADKNYSIAFDAIADL